MSGPRTWDATSLAVVARLGLGDRSVVLRAGGPEAAPVAVDALRESRVPIAGVEARAERDLAWLLEARPWIDLWDEHRRRLAEYEEAFRAFLAEAAPRGLPVIVLKACDDFPYASSNLDLLVPPERMEDAAAILSRLGFHHLCHYREPHKTLHKKFVGGRGAAIIHLHQEVSWDGAIFLDRSLLWSSARPLAPYHGALQLAAADLIALTLAHSVYENAALRVADLRRILRALAAAPLDATRIADMAERHGWRPGLGLALSAAAALERTLRGSSLVAAAFGLTSGSHRDGFPRLSVPFGRWRSRALLATKVVASKAEIWPEKLRLLGRLAIAKIRAGVRLPHHPPLLVALSGMDGSGKSFHAGRLKAFLDQCDVRSVTVWARGGSSPVMLRLKSAARRLSKESGGPLAALPEGAPLAKAWQRLLWPWVICGELLAIYILRVVPSLLGRRVVLSDRHTLDAAVDLSFRLGHPSPRRPTAWRILDRLAPAPGLHLLFDVAPETAMKRKELGASVAHVEARRRRYLEYAPAGTVVIDSGRDADRVGRDVERLVLLALGDRPA